MSESSPDDAISRIEQKIELDYRTVLLQLPAQHPLHEIAARVRLKTDNTAERRIHLAAATAAIDTRTGEFPDALQAGVNEIIADVRELLRMLASEDA